MTGDWLTASMMATAFPRRPRIATAVDAPRAGRASADAAMAARVARAVEVTDVLRALAPCGGGLAFGGGPSVDEDAVEAL